MADYNDFRMTCIHAICMVGPDNEEGIAAFNTPDGPLPMIASDAVRLDTLKSVAQRMADLTGQTYRVVRFSVREDIGVITPKSQDEKVQSQEE